MKLAPLLSQYLFTYKRLDLPGIGSFLLGSTEIIEEEPSMITNATNISFENNSSIKESTELTNFISAQTGKMKALAMGDLDSHLEQARQFLNIGKPFLFEGIGSLVKLKSGELAFISGNTIPDKIKEYSAREISSTSSTEESFTHLNPDNNSKWKKPLVLLLILVGIALAIWGGYTIYKSNPDKNNLSTAIENNQKAKEKETQTNTNSSEFINKENPGIQQTSSDLRNFRFVVEVADKQRGQLRYSTLTGYGLNIKMDSTDSQNYKLFFLLPAAASDTARIIDSLKNLYTPPWGKAFVEN